MRIRASQLPAVAIVTLGVAALACAQEPAKKDSSAERRVTASAAKHSDPVLSDAARVSTEDAAHSAAQTESSSQEQAKGGADQPRGAKVLEFQPAPGASSAQARDGVTSKPKAKKPGSNDLHGSTYGSLAVTNSGSRSGGAEAGTSSRSGKTHVYLHAESSRTEKPK